MQLDATGLRAAARVLPSHMGKIVNLGAQVPANFWESRLLTSELLAAAAQDPALWPGQANKIAKFDVNLRNGALAWQESAQLAIKEIASSSGLPFKLTDSIAQNITDLFTGTPSDMHDLGVQLANVGIGIVTNALSAIPIVGQIAGAIGGIASMLISLAKDTPKEAAEYLPPLQDYKEEIDEAVVNAQVIPSLGTLDWTGLFLPRYKGLWAAYPREHGWAIRGSSAGDGVGMMPGTQHLSGILQTYFLYKSVRKGFQLAEARDQGTFYPGATQILTAVLEQVGKPQTQMYNVDTDLVRRRWRDYLLAAIEWASDAYKGNKAALEGSKLGELTTEQRQAVIGAMMSRLGVSSVGDQIGGVGTYSWSPWAQGNNVFDTFIAPWCDRMRQRQEHYLGTIIGTAYTAEDQAAFRGDPTLLVKLRMNRALLLKSPARGGVRIANMIDPAYREQVFESTVGSTLVAQTPAGGFPPLDANAPPDVPPQPPRGGVPFGDLLSPQSSKVTLGTFVAASLVVAGGAWFARKKGWI